MILKSLIYRIVIAILFLVSCETESKKYIEIENPINFKNGEWISSKDTLSGISIVDGMLAFFDNMKFSGDSIYDYKIVDSVIIFKYREKNIGTYLKRTNLSDTIYSEIIEFSDSILILRRDGELETYTLK